MKPTLSICKYDLGNQYYTLGLPELLNCLIESNVFDVSYHEDRIGALKGEKGATIYYNGKKVYLDVWDYACPTHSAQVYDANFDVIIKLQHASYSADEFDAQCQGKHKLFLDKTSEQRKAFWNKIVPWTFFCSRMMRQFIGKEDEIQPEPIERFAWFCGKSWKCRNWYVKKLTDEGIEYVASSQECFNTGRPLNDEEYIKRMKSCKLGLALHGRSSAFSEAKNRREIDYMMLKKPLLLNYKPFYYNPMIEGKHYIYFDNKTDFKTLESMYNINEIAMNGYQWYKDNASRSGVTQSFLQIMADRFV